MKWPARTMIAFALVCCTAVALFMWIISSGSREANQSTNILASEPIETIQPKKVVVHKQAVKRKLKLPESVQEDQAQHVTAATRVTVDEDRPVEVTAVFDDETGKTTLYEREAELPWLSVQSNTEVGVFAGVRQDGEQAVRLMARHEFARVKQLRLGVIGTADIDRSGDTNGFIGVGVWAKW